MKERDVDAFNKGLTGENETYQKGDLEAVYIPTPEEIAQAEKEAESIVEEPWDDEEES